MVYTYKKCRNRSVVCRSLNPCCNGWCTHTLINSGFNDGTVGVLILVVMDGVHILHFLQLPPWRQLVLILVVMDGVHIQKRLGVLCCNTKKS